MQNIIGALRPTKSIFLEHNFTCYFTPFKLNRIICRKGSLKLILWLILALKLIILVCETTRRRLKSRSFYYFFLLYRPQKLLTSFGLLFMANLVHVPARNISHFLAPCEHDVCRLSLLGQTLIGSNLAAVGDSLIIN